VLFLGEKVGRLGWIAIAMGFAGVMIIIRPGGGLFTWAAILPLGLAVCYSSYQLLTRRIAGVENSINSMVFVMLFGALAMSATLPLSWVAPDGAGCLLLLAVGIVSGCGTLRHDQGPGMGAGLDAGAVRLHSAVVGQPARDARFQCQAGCHHLCRHRHHRRRRPDDGRGQASFGLTGSGLSFVNL
jgi:drug/metabolite transporter (DMT)-like permease